MDQLDLITCIVQRGKAHRAVKAAISAGAQGATVFYARGTGVRQKLGPIGIFIQPEKEVVMIVTHHDETEKIFDAMVKEAQLDKPAMGFAFVSKIEKAVGFLKKNNNKLATDGHG